MNIKKITVLGIIAFTSVLCKEAIERLDRLEQKAQFVVLSTLASSAEVATQQTSCFARSNRAQNVSSIRAVNGSFLAVRYDETRNKYICPLCESELYLNMSAIRFHLTQIHQEDVANYMCKCLRRDHYRMIKGGACEACISAERNRYFQINFK